jgi:hypothetical protein
MERSVQCPYCGEIVELWIDDHGGSSQSYVEDCPVCCRPWQVHVWRDEGGELTAHVAHQDA